MIYNWIQEIVVVCLICTVDYWNIFPLGYNPKGSQISKREHFSCGLLDKEVKILRTW